MNAKNSSSPAAGMIIHNSRIATLDKDKPFVPAVAIADRHVHPINSGTLPSTAFSCSNPLHLHTHTVIGDNGNWGIGCTCFAF